MSFDPGTEYDKPAQRGGFRIADEGKHVVQLTKCDYGVSRAGNPMWTMEFTVLLGDSKGLVIKNWQTLRESDHYDMTQICHACSAKLRKPGSGFDEEDQSDLNEYLFGSVLVLDVEHEEREWKGKTLVDARVQDESIRMTVKSDLVLVKEEHGSAKGPDIAFNDDEVPF